MVVKQGMDNAKEIYCFMTAVAATEYIFNDKIGQL
jgi:hypothetical protein